MVADVSEDALLKLKNVSVGFGGLKALSNVSVSVRAGEVVAVIGPNGAGKTSLFNAITGFVPIQSGQILFKGRRIDGLMAHEIAAHGVRRTFQNNGLASTLTVLENVLCGLHRQIPAHPLSIALGLPAARRAERAALEKAIDKYGRPLVEVFLDHRNINQWMVEQKLGVPYEGKGKKCWEQMMESNRHDDMGVIE